MTMRRRGGATTFSICIPVSGSPIRTSGYNIEGIVRPDRFFPAFAHAAPPTEDQAGTYTMTAGNIRNRHPGLRCFLHNSKLLIRRVLTTALDTGKDFYSINTVRHSRTTRLTPSSYLYRLCPVQIGAAPPPAFRTYNGKSDGRFNHRSPRVMRRYRTYV
jgi:hypothetical protein